MSSEERTFCSCSRAETGGPRNEIVTTAATVQSRRNDNGAASPGDVPLVSVAGPALIAIGPVPV